MTESLDPGRFPLPNTNPPEGLTAAVLACVPTLILIARDAAPKEACGFLYPEIGVLQVENVHAQPERAFAFDPATQTTIMGERGFPSAIWHTHPGNTHGLSEDDGWVRRQARTHVLVCPDGWWGIYDTEREIASGTLDVR